ncbi:MAG: hypothetical protein ACO3RW_05285 [Burkholderiaceae bacterium]
MPIVIPTADELKVMDARAKAQWQRRLTKVMADLNQAWHQSHDNGDVRREAYLWFTYYGTDPDAAEHREQLREALA